MKILNYLLLLKNNIILFFKKYIMRINNIDVDNERVYDSEMDYHYFNNSDSEPEHDTYLYSKKKLRDELEPFFRKKN